MVVARNARPAPKINKTGDVMLKKSLLTLAIAAGIAAPPAAAQQSSSGGEVVGKVVRTYVQESPHLFIDTSLLRRQQQNKQVWSEVRFAKPLENGRGSELVRLPENANVERGDLVSARMASGTEFVPGLLPEVSRMVAVVAKHDTLAAQLFDMPPASVPPTSKSPLMQALLPDHK
jgi:hypothetical protein